MTENTVFYKEFHNDIFIFLNNRTNYEIEITIFFVVTIKYRIEE